MLNSLYSGYSFYPLSCILLPNSSSWKTSTHLLQIFFWLCHTLQSYIRIIPTSLRLSPPLVQSYLPLLSYVKRPFLFLSCTPEGSLHFTFQIRSQSNFLQKSFHDSLNWSGISPHGHPRVLDVSTSYMLPHMFLDSSLHGSVHWLFVYFFPVTL